MDHLDYGLDACYIFLLKSVFSSAKLVLVSGCSGKVPCFAAPQLFCFPVRHNEMVSIESLPYVSLRCHEMIE